MKAILPIILGLFLVSGAYAEAFMTIAPNQAIVCPCERASFEVTIANDEAASRAFDLEVFSDPSITPLLKPSTLVIDANSFETLKMFVTVPCDAAGSYSVSVRASSSFQAGGAFITDVMATASSSILISELGCEIEQPEEPETETEEPDTEIPEPEGNQIGQAEGNQTEQPTGEVVAGDSDSPWIYTTVIASLAAVSLLGFNLKNRQKDE